MAIRERNISAFLKRHQITIAAVLLAMYSLHMALTYKHDIPRGHIVNKTVSFFVNPAQSAITTTSEYFSGLWSNYVFLISVKAENDILRKDIDELKNENGKLKEEIEKSARLKALLEYRDEAEFNTTSASIIGFNGDEWSRTFIINKGSTDGLTRDLAVITPTGAVGKLLMVNSRSSTVLMNTDVRSNIDVYNQRTRTKGVIEGGGEDTLTLKYIRLDDDVALGDQLMTSGLVGTFPKGIPVGIVTNIGKTRDNFFKYIEVTPSVDYRKIEDVLVVKDNDSLLREEEN